MILEKAVNDPVMRLRTKSKFVPYFLPMLAVAAFAGHAAISARTQSWSDLSASNVVSSRSATSSQSDVPTVRFVKNPEPAPEFALTDLAGKTLSPSSFSGKVVLLNFWATWCGPCRAEISGLIALQAKYDDRLQIVGLSTDEGPAENVKHYAERMRMNYPVAIATPEIERKYGGILALPTSFLLDPQGRVVQKHIGLWDQAYFELEIRALLGLPVDAKVETFEDIGQVFLVNASRAQELPGVDVSKLSPEQRKTALRRFNEQTCSCGCQLTLAQCRINDSACSVSKKETATVVREILHPTPPPQKLSETPKP
jgi:thiol-disulfide isomerase/thioredoxin